MISIRFDHVKFSYAHRTIFRDISFQVQQGDRIAVLGENGAGKSTLLKVIATTLSPNGGAISIQQNERKLDRSSFRQHLGLLLDESHFLPSFTVKENLHIFARMHNAPLKAVDPWLDRLRLRKYVDTKLSSLSKGEQKKVSLVKAMLHNPSVLILDEPSDNLDHASTLLLGDILNQAKDTLVVCTTHQSDWCKQWATRTIVVKDQGIKE